MIILRVLIVRSSQHNFFRWVTVQYDPAMAGAGELIDRVGDCGRNAGGAEFANAASAGRACMRVEFVDEMHLNGGWNIRVHGQGNARQESLAVT